MKNTFLIITSIASDSHPVLTQFAQEAASHNVTFIVIGDKKSPEFQLKGCNFYSIEKQQSLPFHLVNELPYNHYARKNLGYLTAISKGAEIIIETDDDNFPSKSFWKERVINQNAYSLYNKGWVNIYKYYTNIPVWPRGFALENAQNDAPEYGNIEEVYCPIQQGLADLNPDVDAIYRLVLPLPIKFNKNEMRFALGQNTICPFNSQNTTWFKDAFMLLYLPSYCSFRMTDIWRSFIAQRIMWTCGWNLLFHESTVWQERNEHAILKDFNDEIVGYLHNKEIMDTLSGLKLKNGVSFISQNMRRCYEELVGMNLIGEKELQLLDAWIADINCLK
jgi:hypothetical protein